MYQAVGVIPDKNRLSDLEKLCSKAFVKPLPAATGALESRVDLLVADDTGVAYKTGVPNGNDRVRPYVRKEPPVTGVNQAVAYGLADIIGGLDAGGRIHQDELPGEIVRLTIPMYKVPGFGAIAVLFGARVTTGGKQACRD